jgi:hypothetical protein
MAFYSANKKIIYSKNRNSFKGKHLLVAIKRYKKQAKPFSRRKPRMVYSKKQISRKHRRRSC